MSQLRLSFSALVITGMLFTVACGPQSEDTSSESNTSTVQLTETAKAKPGTGQFCGGFAAIQCPEGLVCVDDPNDSCDPNTGGADCGGLCVKETRQTAEKKKCDYKDPTRHYAARSPDECAAVTFICVEGQTAFFDECGCGCETNP